MARIKSWWSTIQNDISIEDIQEKFNTNVATLVDGVTKIGELRQVQVDAIPAGWTGLDIGKQSIQTFSDILKEARTVVWNGPMGVFEIEQTARGTYAIANILAQITATGATTVIGGGDSAAAVNKAGVSDKVSHVSTGGGASLEFMEGKTLPGLAALTIK
jgi:phosphoglycerate kinase